VHTLNGSALAVGRTWVAIVENYQQADAACAFGGPTALYGNGLYSGTERVAIHEFPNTLATTEASTALEGRSPMGAIWRTIRGYILWSYERGSLHYDIMVTLILLFIFVSPHFLNYKDKPWSDSASHRRGVIPGKGELIYQIQSSRWTRPRVETCAQLEKIIERFPARSASPMSKRSRTFRAHAEL